MAKYVLSAFADEVTPVFDKQLEYLKKQNIKYIEPRNIDGTNVSSLTLSQAKDVKKKLDSYGIGVSSVGSPIGKIHFEDDFDEHLKLLENTIDIAEIFETKNIRMFSFYCPRESDPHEFREKVFPWLEKLLEVAEKRNVNLCHENEKAIYGEAPEDCLEIMEHFGGRMKSVLDMGNFAFCQKNPMLGYELLHPYIEYIHIKDSYYDANIVPPGQGDGQIPEILAKFDKYTDKKVFLTLEPHLTVFSGLEKLSNLDDLKGQNKFATPDEAFDVATSELRKILANIGQIV